MRGKPRRVCHLQRRIWITPAGAGKTAKALTNPTPCRDHPRRCGENKLSQTDSVWDIGSPPQVRGKPLGVTATVGQTRITPAGAGKTFNPESVGGLEEDHPRRCGENPTLRLHLRRCTGSPPQVRGKPTHKSLMRQSPRITPAGAGKTPSYVPPFAVLPDHPRRCGENRAGWLGLSDMPGSPPQVRGKPISSAFVISFSRITPAGAGKTVLYAACNALNEDHPRKCGENDSTALKAEADAGSPPQVRGKLGTSLEDGHEIQDHPRRCGENSY